MTEETKKISFGFSKLKKPTNLVKPVETVKPEIEYVDSFDGVKGEFSYKGNVRCEPVKKELVIPLIGTKSALEVIKARLEEKESIKNNKNIQELDKVSNGDKAKNLSSKEESVKIENVQDGKKPSIDELAAREILQESQNSVLEEKSSNQILIKQPTKTNNSGDEKDIPIDYENIPVTDFGLAMLRGMGWTPETGIGKDQRVVQVVAPKLRPKGLGLGADKLLLKKDVQDGNQDLNLSIKGFVKVLNGPNKGSYGQVEAMDDDSGRVLVKLALGGTISVSEILLIPVTKKEYETNSKVLNPTKYENYKDDGKEMKSKGKSDRENNLSENGKGNNIRHRKEEYDRRDDYGRHRMKEKQRSSSSPERRSEHRKKRKSSKNDKKDGKHKKKRKKKYSSDSDSDRSEGRSSRRDRPGKSYSDRFK